MCETKIFLWAISFAKESSRVELTKTMTFELTVIKIKLKGTI